MRAAAPSCPERLQAAGVDASRLTPGERGRLDGYDFIVARDDSAARICARVDAERQKIETLRSQLSNADIQLAKAQAKADRLGSGGPIKQNYLVIDGILLGWAIIASIWASYFAGRLGSRRHHSF